MAVTQPDDAAPKADPGDRHGRVETLGIVLATLRPGGVIGPHRHDVDEAITVLEGEAEVELDGDVRAVAAGGVAFIPAGVPHLTRNRGERPIRIHTVFAATAVEIADVEGHPPSRARFDLRTGEYRPLGAASRR